MESAPLPTDSVAQCATAMSSRHKSVATIFLWLDGLFIVAAIAMLFDKSRADATSLAGGMAFWVGLFTILAVRSLVKARKMTNLGARATSDSALRWFLSGKMIVATSQTGAPQPDLSFKITQKLLTVLTAVPRAQVVNS